jgi:ABC-type sugar transport system permease subunit
MGYVFLIPGFVFLGCFLVFPFFKSLVRSFTDWNAFGSDLSFVGLKNY